MIQNYPLIPLPDNGSALVYPLAIHHLCLVTKEALSAMSDELRGRIWFLHQPSPVTLREILTTIRRKVGSSCLFVPVPSIIILGVLLIVERFPFLRLGLSSTNIQGLRASTSEEFRSDFKKFGLSPQTLDELVEQGVRRNGL